MPALIPAIDVLNGACVRLRQGDPSQVTEYDPDPAAVAAGYAAAGAGRLHLVDLDAALYGAPKALGTLARIAATGVKVQYGGGLRSLARIEAALAAGAAWVVCGTAALADEGFLAGAAGIAGDHLILALDLRDGRLLAKGWREAAAIGLDEAMQRARRHGVKTVAATDTGGDGTMAGLRPEVFADLWDQGCEVIIGGGVASLDDLRRLAPYGGRGLAGVVVGSALLNGSFGYRDGVQALVTAADLPEGKGE